MGVREGERMIGIVHICIRGSVFVRGIGGERARVRVYLF